MAIHYNSIEQVEARLDLNSLIKLVSNTSPRPKIRDWMIWYRRMVIGEKLVTIGDKYHLSRERIRVIANSMNRKLYWAAGRPDFEIWARIHHPRVYASGDWYGEDKYVTVSLATPTVSTLAQTSISTLGLYSLELLTDYYPEISLAHELSHSDDYRN